MVSASSSYMNIRSQAPKVTGLSRFIGMIVLAVLALLYVAQASQVSTKSVEIQNLRQKAVALSNDVDQLQLESARAQTLDMISTQASPLGLVPVDSVEYLNQ